MRTRVVFACVLLLVTLSGIPAASVAKTTASAFSNQLLISTFTPPSGYSTAPNANSTGNSEPAIAIGADSTMVVGGLSWLPYQIDMWRGRAGGTPAFFGAMDTVLPTVPGRIALGDGDEDIDIGSTGTIHLADLDFIVNRPFTSFTLGVSVTNCPGGASGPGGCATKILDTAGADRQWITSLGRTVWVSYHDSGSSTLIHVQRSTDDGATWRRVGSPIPGQGAATGDATFNNTQGPLVADPTTGYLFDVYTAGEPGIQKGTSASFNNVYVSRSLDGGDTWGAVRVFHAPLFTDLSNVFPSLAVDPVDGALYAVWSDGHVVSLATSGDHGATWSAAQVVSRTTTAIFPWVAARGGKVDVVYYGTNAGSKDDPTAVWNVYDAQRKNGVWNGLRVSNAPNHVGVICTSGTACASGTRNLLDLFEVAIDPATGAASVIYVDDTVDTWSDPNGVIRPLPEIVLAQEQ